MIKQGDRISTLGSDDFLHFATVVSVESERIQIKWDNFSGHHEYKVSEIVGVWSFQGKTLVAEDFGACSHLWKKYHGFREEYLYCEKCDLKQGK